MSERPQRVPERLDSMQSTKVLFSSATGFDDPDWMRAWPFGPVHYSEDWSSLEPSSSRFPTVCGKTPRYWPTADWPEQDVCPECKAWVEKHGTAAPMAYALTPPAPTHADEEGEG